MPTLGVADFWRLWVPRGRHPGDSARRGRPPGEAAARVAFAAETHHRGTAASSIGISGFEGGRCHVYRLRTAFFLPASTFVSWSEAYHLWSVASRHLSLHFPTHTPLMGTRKPEYKKHEEEKQDPGHNRQGRRDGKTKMGHWYFC